MKSVTNVTVVFHLSTTVHHLMWCIYCAWWIDDHLLEHQVTQSTRIQHVQWISQASCPNTYNHPEMLFSAKHCCTFLLPLLIVLVVLYQVFLHLHSLNCIHDLFLWTIIKTILFMIQICTIINTVLFTIHKSYPFLLHTWTSPKTTSIHNPIIIHILIFFPLLYHLCDTPLFPLYLP